jgi:predicted NAD/FAD-binding protein
MSYSLNRLQAIPGPTDYIVTLNASDRMRTDRVLSRMAYRHPVYNEESVRARARLPELTTSRVAFAGAYHGWGFHEDGCTSGVRAAAAFGVLW